MMSAKQVIVVIVVLFAVYAAFDSMFVVDERERVVVVELGEIVGQNYPPGLHFKVPFIQNARAFDNRILTLSDEIERALTSENKNLSMDFFVKWRIADTVDYYLSTQGSENRARSLITEIVQNDLLAELSKRTIRKAIDDQRNEIVATVQVKADQDAEELGIDIVEVRIMRLDLPAEVSESVYERMRSERQEVIKALQAQGEAAAQVIRTDADRERTIMLAEAYRKAQEIRGEGDATAAEVYANAYSDNSEFYSFYRSLELYRESVGDRDILVLEPEGKLFQHFNPPMQVDAQARPAAGSDPLDLPPS